MSLHSKTVSNLKSQKATSNPKVVLIYLSAGLLHFGRIGNLASVSCGDEQEMTDRMPEKSFC